MHQFWGSEGQRSRSQHDQGPSWHYALSSDFWLFVNPAMKRLDAFCLIGHPVVWFVVTRNVSE